jgi:DNA-binding FrmR family transcriptional regulator
MDDATTERLATQLERIEGRLDAIERQLRALERHVAVFTAQDPNEKGVAADSGSVGEL